MNGQNLIFNEVMSANQATITDNDGDTPDWFELHNAGSGTINLVEYSVNDNADSTNAWRFPTYSLESGEYLLVFASGKDKVDFPIYWETLITEGDTWRYTVPSATTSPVWKNKTFDDSGWNEGASGFGYGDDDDNTVLEGIISVFIRKTFTIEDISEVTDVLFHMDFDDAFVAYINGVEIARDNITTNGAPAYNALADNSTHEPKMAYGGMPDAYPITDFNNLLLNGENVLAIQIHNAGANSSDLSAIPFLSIGSATPRDGNVADFIDLPLVKFHTDFKISSEGETLHLFKNNALADSLTIPFLPSDISYGRNENIDNTWQYFAESTPEAVNNTQAYDTLAAQVYFSKPGGIYTGLVVVTLSTDNPGDKIYYTVDGTEPTKSSTLYTKAITINKTTGLRAAVINDFSVPGFSNSQSYFFNVNHDLPIISIITDPDHFFDDYTGIYVNGAIRHPSSGKDCDNGQNFWQDWEKPIHVSMINPDGTLAFEQNAGVKIFGGCSRTFAQKSLSLRFRKSYGKDGLDYKVFDDLDVDKFYSLNLRNSGNDWNNTMMKDAALTKLFPEQLAVQAYRPSVVYINGEYWGIHNIRERMNEDYIASHNDVDEATVNMMEFHVNYKLNVLEGDGQSYLDLLDYIEQNGVTSSEDYNHVKTQMDVVNFALYQACNIAIRNTDWPGNNVKFYSSEELDNKWRWLVYDLDFGFQNLYHNTLDFALAENGPHWPNPPESTYLLRQLNTNQEFQNVFINAFADVFNTLWKPEYFNPIVHKMKADISGEMQNHMNRWGGNYFAWSGRVDDFYNYAAARPEVIRDYVRNRYDLTGTYALNLKVNDSDMGSIALNTIHPEKYPWTGIYFNNVPVTLKAQPKKGYRFVRWTGASSSTNDSITLNKKSNTLIEAVFEADDNYEDIVVINEIFYANLSDETPDDWVELYNAGSQTVNLSNWMLKDENNTHVFSLPTGTTIPSKGYLVVCRDSLAYTDYYGNTGNGFVLGNIDYGFGNGADIARLYNYQEVLVDSVSYNNTLPTNTLFTYQRFTEGGSSVWYSIGGAGTPNALNNKGIVLDVGSSIKIENVKVNVHPNPFDTNLKLDIQLTKAQNVSIAIMNINGSVIDLLHTGVYSEGRQQIVWTKGKNLAPGVYLLQIRTNDQVISRKVVKR